MSPSNSGCSSLPIPTIDISCSIITFFTYYVISGSMVRIHSRYSIQWLSFSLASLLSTSCINVSTVYFGLIHEVYVLLVISNYVSLSHVDQHLWSLLATTPLPLVYLCPFLSPFQTTCSNVSLMSNHQYSINVRLSSLTLLDPPCNFDMLTLQCWHVSHKTSFVRAHLSWPLRNFLIIALMWELQQPFSCIHVSRYDCLSDQTHWGYSWSTLLTNPSNNLWCPLVFCHDSLPDLLSILFNWTSLQAPQCLVKFSFVPQSFSSTGVGEIITPESQHSPP